MAEERRRDIGGRSISLAFALSALASIGLTIVYALGGQPQIEGILIFVSLGGLAYGLIQWGKRFMPQGPFVQERDPLSSTAKERRVLQADVEASEAILQRRGFLKWLGLAALALGAAAVFPVRSLGPKPGRSLFHTSWRRGSRVVTSDGRPVTIDDLQEGGILTVFPEGHTGAADSQTVLIRINQEIFRPLEGRETWAPDGYVAYSKICTHAGCPVGLYEAESSRLFCPCHQSLFDVLNGAKPLAGPATRALPQLPLQVGSGGELVAQSDFPEPVGPGFWNLP
jgi:quinol---cytochrome c reductase iron-sulfur subunit